MTVQGTLWLEDRALVCGVDEAGRGPLAGAVYAAAVILDPARPISGLRDSKKLSASQRQRLRDEIFAKACAWAIAHSTVEEIDQLNILQATLLAMRRAVEQLQPQATLALVDGNQAPRLSIPVQTLVKGDALEPAISAASILAKTERDAAMLALHAEFPQYGFADHKGYPTATHLQALEQHGLCHAHRRSYKPVQSILKR
ncbi:MAG: ribonuclease HII [Burkholderiaceae bacterium]|nr:MAG: ribonuclease HII [Burkholderiaceae bacterium]